MAVAKVDRQFAGPMVLSDVHPTGEIRVDEASVLSQLLLGDVTVVAHHQADRPV
jgi:hypothetical protein